MIAPGLIYRTPFGFFIEARRDPLAYLERLTPRFGRIARVHSWPFLVMEAQIILAMITQRSRWHAAPGYRVEREVRVTLRPRHGVRLVLSVV